MRKMILAFSTVFMMFVATNAYSQVNIGFKAGANLGKLDGVAYKEQFKLGYQLGGFVSVGLGKLAIQGELLFDQTNTTIKDSYSSVWDDKFDKGKKLNYLSVPILLKLNPNGFISVLAGPQFSVLTNRSENLWQNGEKLFKGSDFSFVTGAEINLAPFFIYGRYVWGFADISDFGSDKAKTQQIQLGVGLKF
ncbi:MAG: porin family protein [Capnocytophaga sp.]|nr:porin family protein [Capnocytophaga sp.]